MADFLDKDPKRKKSQVTVQEGRPGAVLLFGLTTTTGIGITKGRAAATVTSTASPVKARCPTAAAAATVGNQEPPYSCV
ncbi:unnamed protein product [Arctogadus glacialis]